DVISTPQEAVARAWGWRGQGEVVGMCGPSGCGKSTWLVRHAADDEVVSLDTLRERLAGRRGDQSVNGQVIAPARAQAREALRNQRRVFIDATMLRADFRRQWFQLGRDYRALVRLVVFRPSLDGLYARNAARPQATRVPSVVLERQIDRYQLPWPDDAHRVEWVS